MVIKRYIVNNMNEAMTRIRYELGKDAVIISQRKIRKPGVKGLFSKKVIEVTAAVENMVNPQDESVKSSIEAIKKVMEQETINKEIYKDNKKCINDLSEKIEDVEQNSFIKKNHEPIDLLNEVKEMKSMISELTKVNSSAKNDKTDKSDIEKILEDNDVDEDNVKKILDKIKNMEIQVEDYEKLKIVLKEMIHIKKTKLEGKIVLVGPTGVGKTTTIAKLAGRLALLEKKKVGLITVDTYRIGAVEQLKTYADIMNIPFKVVYNMKDMEDAIANMKDCEVILIDTTGRSSKNKMQISELRTFVEKADTENIHLVLSCTTKNKDVKSIIEGYQILNYNGIIITKLDETSTYGSIINILQNAKTALSFVATGQNVPDDLKEFSADEIVNLVLGEDTIC